MIAYFVVYFFLLYNALILKNNRLVILTVILLLSLFIGFRGIDVGTDTIRYYDIYESFEDCVYDGYPEPLYSYTCILANYLGLSCQVHFFLLCLFSFTFFYKYVKDCPNMGMSFFLLLTFCFICYAMNIYAQIMTCLICSYAYRYLESKDLKDRLKYLLIVLFAMGFHLSAVFLIPLLLIHKLRLTWKLVFLSFMLSFMIGLVDVTSFFSQYMLGYEKHLERSTDIKRYIQGVAFSFYWMLAFIYLYWNSKKEVETKIQVKIFFAGIIVYNLFLSKDLALRFLLYFILPLTYWIPYYLESQSNRRKWNQFLIIVYSSIFYFTLVFTNSADIVPYYFSISE